VRGFMRGSLGNGGAVDPRPGGGVWSAGLENRAGGSSMKAKEPPMARPPIEMTNDPSSLDDRVQGVLELIRPMIRADGGDIEYVETTDEGVVRIRFQGACVGCPSSSMTLRMGIESNLKQHVPEVRGVEAVNG